MTDAKWNSCCQFNWGRDFKSFEVMQKQILQICSNFDQFCWNFLFAIYKTVYFQSTSHDACVFADIKTKIFLSIVIDCVLRKELKMRMIMKKMTSWQKWWRWWRWWVWWKWWRWESWWEPRSSNHLKHQSIKLEANMQPSTDRYKWIAKQITKPPPQIKITNTNQRPSSYCGFREAGILRLRPRIGHLSHFPETPLLTKESFNQMKSPTHV